EVLSLFLAPFSLALRPHVGLVVKGKVDDVRRGSRRAKFLPINGVEIIGYGQPANPSCEFLEELSTIQFARIYAYNLTHLDNVGSLAQLRHLQLTHVLRGQVIAVDLGTLRKLKRAVLHWFTGAETIFGAKQLRDLMLTGCPISNSQPIGQLDNLLRLRLISGRLREVGSLRQLTSLCWRLCTTIASSQTSEGFLGIPQFSSFGSRVAESSAAFNGWRGCRAWKLCGSLIAEGSVELKHFNRYRD